MSGCTLIVLIYLTLIFFWHLVLCRAEITWHPKKCLTQKLVKKSRNGSKKAKGLTNAKPMTNKSFFDFFSPPKIPKNLKDKEDIIEVIEVVVTRYLFPYLLVRVYTQLMSYYLFVFLNSS